MTYSMQFNTVGAVAVILYLAIPLGYVLDMIFFKITLTPMEVAGAAIIVVVNIAIAVMRICGCINEIRDEEKKDD